MLHAASMPDEARPNADAQQPDHAFSQIVRRGGISRVQLNDSSEQDEGHNALGDGRDEWDDIRHDLGAGGQPGDYSCSEGVAEDVLLEEDTAQCPRAVVDTDCGPAQDHHPLYQPGDVCLLTASVQHCRETGGSDVHPVTSVSHRQAKGGQSTTVAKAEFDMDVVNIAEQESILAMIRASQRRCRDSLTQNDRPRASNKPGHKRMKL